MGKSVMENFDVSITSEMNKQAILTEKSLAKLKRKDIMSQLNEIEPKEGEIENIAKTLIGIMNNLSQDKEVRTFLDELVEDEFSPEIKKKREELMKRGIRKLCKMLITNEYMIAASKKPEERRKEYDKLLKCMCALARVFVVTKRDPIDIVGKLAMIAEAGDVCASGWKDTLTSIVLDFKEDLESMFVGVELKKDDMEELLKEVFFEAKESVARELEYKYIKDNEVFESERPHYIDVMTRTLNEVYKLNLPQMELEDSYMSKEKQRLIKNHFIIAIENAHIYKKIYDKACEFFYDKFKENGAPYGVLSEWANHYIKKNELGEYADDVSDFMSTYLMTGEYGEKIRYVAIREIMKDYSFVEERTRDISIMKIFNSVDNASLKRVMYDVKTPQEIERMNKDLVTLYNEGKDIKFVFDFLKETKNYEIISKETIEEIIRIGGKEDKKLLLAFCEIGYNDAAKLLLNSGNKFDIKAKNDEEETALMLALKNNMDQEIIEQLLKKGVSINVMNNDEETTLMVALKAHAKQEIIERLLEKDAYINAKNKNEETPLMIALKNNAKPEVIEKLLKKGAHLNAKNKYGETPLMIALKNNVSSDVINVLLNGKTNKIKKLMGKKIDLNKKNKNGETALMIAFKEKVDDKIIMELLNHGASVNKKDNNKNSVLMYALKYNASLEVITRMLKDVKDINLANVDNDIALSFACRYNADPKVIKAMIDMGANVNRQDKLGHTPLAYASKYGKNPEVLNMLLDAGADVNAECKDKDTALMYALKYNDNQDIVRTLVKRGADVNAVNKNRVTPLMVALKYSKNLELIRFILNNQNSINSVGEKGYTALMIASKYIQNEEIITLILKKGANVNKTNDDGDTALIIASEKSENEGVIKTLIENGTDVNISNKKGYTALMLASGINGNEEIVKELLERGADVNKSTTKGYTALMLASLSSGKEKIVKALLDAGADVNMSNQKGWTALMLASKFNANEEIIQAMIEKGADLNKKNEKGETAANIARVCNPQIVDQVETNNVLDEIKKIKPEKGKEIGLKI